MQKVLLIFLLLCIAAPSLHAQDSNGRRSVVINLGLNASKFSEENNDDAECLRCLCFGADFIFCQNGPLLFSTGMNYTSSGSEYKFGEDGGEGGSYSIETHSVLGYLNIPLEAQYEFGAGKVKPFVRGGGMFGLLLSAKNKTKTNFNGQENEDETDIKDQ